MLKMRTFLLFLLLSAVLTFPLYAQKDSVRQESKFFIKVGDHHNLNGGEFQELEEVVLSYRFYSLFTARLGVSHTGLYPFQERDGKRLGVYTLSLSRVAINRDRFQMIPTFGFGVAEGKDSQGNFARFIADWSVEMRYFVTETVACGIEYRQISSGRVLGSSDRRFTASYWLGMTMTTFF